MAIFRRYPAAFGHSWVVKDYAYLNPPGGSLDA